MNNNAITKYRDKNWLQQKYWQEGLNCAEIAQLINVSKSTIIKWRLKLGVKSRTKSEIQTGKVVTSTTRRKISIGNKGKVVTKKTRKKLSVANKGKRLSKAHRKKLSESHKGQRPWMLGRTHSKKTRARISKNQKGRKLTPEWKENIRKSLIGRDIKWKDKISKSRMGIAPDPKCGNCKGSRYRGTWMRSSWELAYAKDLDKQKIKWVYEPKAFPLVIKGKKTTYRPDFYLPKEDKYVEIKGYYSPVARAKVRAFKKKYPKIKYEILFKEDLVKLGINL